MVVERLRRLHDELPPPLQQHRVSLAVGQRDPVRHRVPPHPDVEVRVGQPRDPLLHRGDRAGGDLGVEVVGQGLDEAALDGRLLRQEGEVPGVRKVRLYFEIFWGFPGMALRTKSTQDRHHEHTTRANMRTQLRTRRGT